MIASARAVRLIDDAVEAAHRYETAQHAAPEVRRDLKQRAMAAQSALIDYVAALEKIARDVWARP